jgi:Family of unknown function (DUF6427)
VTGIFKANNPSGNFVLFVYALILKLPLFIHTSMPTVQPLDGIFYKAFLSFISPVAKGLPIIYSIITFFLLFIQAILFNKIANDQKLLKQNNYLTGMSYLLITSMFSDWFTLSAPLIVNTFLIWIFTRITVLYNNPKAKATIFNIGLATGLAAFVYFPSITFLILVIVGIAIFRPFSLQEWILGLVGIITPVYFYGSYLFFTNNTKLYQFPGFHLSHPIFTNNKWAYVVLFAILIVAAIGLYFINSNINRQVVQTRKSWQLLFLYLIVAVLVPFINAGFNFSYWILVAVPLSPICAAAFFYPQKKYIPLVLHWSLVGLYIASQFLVK